MDWMVQYKNVDFFKTSNKLIISQRYKFQYKINFTIKFTKNNAILKTFNPFVCVFFYYYSPGFIRGKSKLPCRICIVHNLGRWKGKFKCQSL